MSSWSTSSSSAQRRLPSQVSEADSKPLSARSAPEVWVTVVVTNSPALRRTEQVALTKVAPSVGGLVALEAGRVRVVAVDRDADCTDAGGVRVEPERGVRQ